MSEFIPNSVQTPNYYFDRVMALLTSDEWKILSYAVRRVFGFQKRRDFISISQFVDGTKSRADGHILDYGTGLSKPTVMKCLKSLMYFNLIILTSLDKDRGDNKGNEYELQLDSNKVNWAALEGRHNAITKDNQIKMRAIKQVVNGIDHPKVVNGIDHQVVNGIDHQVVNGIDTQYTEEKQGNQDNTGGACAAAALGFFGDEIKNQSALEALGNGIKRELEQEARFDVSQFPEDVQPVIHKFCQLFKRTPPARPTNGKGGDFALWISDSRALLAACEEFGLDLLDDLYRIHREQTVKNNGVEPFTIARPGALTKKAQSRVGELRIQESNPGYYNQDRLPDDPVDPEPVMPEPNQSVFEPIPGCAVTPFEAWEKVKAILKDSMQRGNYNNYIDPTRAMRFENGVLTIGTTSFYSRDWLRQRVMSAAIRQLRGVVHGVDFNPPKIELVFEYFPVAETEAL